MVSRSQLVSSKPTMVFVACCILTNRTRNASESYSFACSRSETYCASVSVTGGGTIWCKCAAMLIERQPWLFNLL